MIELSQTRERMRKAIASSPRDAPLICDLEDPRVVSLDEFRFDRRVATRAEILTALAAAFRRRLVGVSDARLERDLLQPLKKGLGNAEKRGNRGDPRKRIRVEAAATRRGIFVAIGDEGAGFDVAATVDRMRAAQTYFVHGGSGLQILEKSRALVSYEDGGRTLLICFQIDPMDGRPLRREERSDLHTLADEERMGAALVALLGAERAPTLQPRSCRISVEEEGAPPRELRYVLEVGHGDAPISSRHVWIGRILPESAGRTELCVARSLRHGALGGESPLRVPEVRALPGHPNLVLYQFEPIRDLRSHLSRGLPDEELHLIVRRVAGGLRRLHQTNVAALRAESRDDAIGTWHDAAHRIRRSLAAIDAEAASRVDRILAGIEAQTAELDWPRAVPVHGSFGFDCLRVAADGLWLYRFDRSRRSHPGVDVGTFLADLLRFHRVRRDRDPARLEPLRASFLAAYRDGDSMLEPNALAAFVAGALLLRLERLLARPAAKWARKLGRLLDECEHEIEAGASCAAGPGWARSR